MARATPPTRRPSGPFALLLAAGTAVLLAAPAAGSALPAPFPGPLSGPTPDEGPEDPLRTARDQACTSATETIRILPPSHAFLNPFTPPCIVAENQGIITWENRDRGAHDPGDGVEDERERALCFRAAVTIEDQRHVDPGETYSIQLRFDAATETLFLEKVWHDGERQDLNGDDPGLGTIECNDHAWTWQDDGVVAVDYMCHLHDNGDGRILLEV